MKRTCMLVLVAAALPTWGCRGGCVPIDDDFMGELGRAEFAWDEGILGCLFGCDAGEPMATRSVATIIVQNDEELPPFDVSSDDPSAITFTHDGPGDASIRAESHVAGHAKLVLTNASTGEVIDRFRIDVRDVDRIRASDEDLYRDTFTIMVGGERTIYLDLRDADRNELVGVGGVDYTLTGGLAEEHFTLVDAFADLLVSILVGTTQDYVTVEALALGSGALVVSAPSGASLSIPARIVDESAVTAVTLEGEATGPVGETINLDARALAGDERVHDPLCAWSIEPAEGPVAIDGEYRDSISLEATSPGSATVTCSVGTASDSRTVRFE
jgi:hypothetical protein